VEALEGARGSCRTDDLLRDRDLGAPKWTKGGKSGVCNLAEQTVKAKTFSWIWP
jgi:hypothetical protein